MAEDLPYELEKRKSILIAMMGLDRLLSDVPVGYSLPEWAPPSLGLYKDNLFFTVVCPDAQRLLDNPLRAYNLRMLELARSVTRWADYLRIAGLSKGDLHTWKVQTYIEKAILQDTEEAQDGDGFLYVATKGYSGEFSTGDIRWRAELWEERLSRPRSMSQLASRQLSRRQRPAISARASWCSWLSTQMPVKHARTYSDRRSESDINDSLEELREREFAREEMRQRNLAGRFGANRSLHLNARRCRCDQTAIGSPDGLEAAPSSADGPSFA